MARRPPQRLYRNLVECGLGLMCCHDLKGKLLWSKNLGTYKTRYGWGTAASPVLHRGRLYVVNDNEEQSYLAAYDAGNGPMWILMMKGPGSARG